MSEARNETQLTARIVRAVVREYPEAWVLKTHGTGYQRKGIPDLLICLHGRFYGFEVKHPKPGESPARTQARVTAQQRKEIRLIRAAGGAAHVVTTIDEVLAALAS